MPTATTRRPASPAGRRSTACAATPRIEERTRYDLYYVENWSLLFDIKIIVKTIWLVLQPDTNAY